MLMHSHCTPHYRTALNCSMFNFNVRCTCLCLASEILVNEVKYCTDRKLTLVMCNLVSRPSAGIKDQAANGLRLSLMDQTHTQILASCILSPPIPVFEELEIPLIIYAVNNQLGLCGTEQSCSNIAMHLCLHSIVEIGKCLNSEVKVYVWMCMWLQCELSQTRQNWLMW